MPRGRNPRVTTQQGESNPKRPTPIKPRRPKSPENELEARPRTAPSQRIRPSNHRESEERPTPKTIECTQKTAVSSKALPTHPRRTKPSSAGPEQKNTFLKPEQTAGHRPNDVHFALEKLDKKLDRLTVAKESKNSNAAIKNVVIEEVLKCLQKETTKWKHVNSGSISEATKIQKADEFDALFVLEDRFKPSYNTESGSGLEQFCTFRIIKSEYRSGALDQHICGDLEKSGGFRDISKEFRHVSPILFKKYFRTVISPIFSKNFHPDIKRIKDLGSDECSPAVTVKVYPRFGASFDMDLVPAIKIYEWPKPAESFFKKKTWATTCLSSCGKETVAVAKPHHSEYGKDAKQCKYFRISFSKQENVIMLHADGTANEKYETKDKKITTCRKQVYKLLKLDLANIEETVNKLNGRDILSSYSLKTLMLHMFCDLKDQWNTKTRGPGIVLLERYVDALKRLCEALRCGVIEHFFIPDVNILTLSGKSIPKEKRRQLEKYFTEILNDFDVQVNES